MNNVKRRRTLGLLHHCNRMRQGRFKSRCIRNRNRYATEIIDKGTHDPQSLPYGRQGCALNCTSHLIGSTHQMLNMLNQCHHVLSLGGARATQERVGHAQQLLLDV